MSNAIEGVKAANGLMRTLLMLVVAAVIGWSGWIGYTQFILPAQQSREALAQIEVLKSELAEAQTQLQTQRQALAQAQQDNERLQTALKLLKINRRLAQITVLEQGHTDEDEPYMVVSFVEVNDVGQAIGPAMPFRLRGERLYLDCWIVKFEDRYIEQADVLRGASLCIFKGLWGELDGPMGGHSLDALTQTTQSPPGIYRHAADVTAFERQIWHDFWSVANDRRRQREMGIRANHGEAPYVLVEPGMTYHVELRASGGVSIVPMDN